MTCIVALKRNGTVYMGGDAASVSISTYETRRTAHPKLFQNGNYLMGYTSSFRMGQLLQYKLNLPAPAGNLHNFMCTTFVDEVRKVLKDNGYVRIDNNEECAGTFLIGVQGQIFEMQDDMHISTVMDDYTAVGCGASYALGAMFRTGRFSSPKRILQDALEAAEHFSIGVRGPFTFMQNSS